MKDSRKTGRMDVKFLNNIMKSYREQIMYLVFGVFATIISIVVFNICIDWFSMGPLYANLVSWVIAVSFAYCTNRKIVFCSQDNRIVKQLLLFMSGRVATLLLEELIFVVLMKVRVQVKLIKLIGQAAVIITNYIISKLIVFRKTAEKSE